MPVSLLEELEDSPLVAQLEVSRPKEEPSKVEELEPLEVLRLLEEPMLELEPLELLLDKLEPVESKASEPGLPKLQLESEDKLEPLDKVV